MKKQNSVLIQALLVLLLLMPGFKLSCFFCLGPWRNERERGRKKKRKMKKQNSVLALAVVLAVLLLSVLLLS